MLKKKKKLAGFTNEKRCIEEYFSGYCLKVTTLQNFDFLLNYWCYSLLKKIELTIQI